MEIRLLAPAIVHDDELMRADTFTLPRLSLQVLAALTPEGHEVTIVDESFGPDPLEPVPDLVGITATTHVALRAYQLADAWRRRGARVVLGGIHPTVLPREALQHADAVVRGEAEGVWQRVVADASEGKLRKVYGREAPVDLAGMARPRRDLYPRRWRWMPFTQGVETSRGCTFACEFCSIAPLMGGRYRTRPVADIVADLAAIPDRAVFLVDDALALNRRHAREMFAAMEGLGKRWVGQGAVSLAEDPALLAAMRRSGCVGLLVGIESVQEAPRKALAKMSGLAISCDEAVRRFHDAGISIVGSFVFGLDHETPDVFDATLDFAERCHLDGTNPCLLHPYPGTRLYERLTSEGRLLEPLWWLRRFSEIRVPFRPLGMSVEQLVDGWIRFGRGFHSLGSILRRLSGMPLLKRGALGLAAYVFYNAGGRRFFNANSWSRARQPTGGW
jgi:radical SAM superfamily enzyme YgiQ (UPF0313 family)